MWPVHEAKTGTGGTGCGPGRIPGSACNMQERASAIARASAQSRAMVARRRRIDAHRHTAITLHARTPGISALVQSTGHGEEVKRVYTLARSARYQGVCDATSSHRLLGTLGVAYATRTGGATWLIMMNHGRPIDRKLSAPTSACTARAIDSWYDRERL